MSTRFFRVIDKLLPKSNAFYLVVNKRLTQFFTGLAALPEDCRDCFQRSISELNPETATLLEEWEEEFGIGFPAASEEDRRNDIASRWKATGGQARDYIQEVLNNAGFDVQVHENNPPVDPDLFLNSVPVMVAGGANAYAGRSDAFAGKTGGELLVNGPILTNIPIYNSVAGVSTMVAGNTLAKAGQFDKFGIEDRIYTIPDNSDLWGGFFFIGGDATRNSSFELTAIENVNIPADREAEFKRLILQIKPAQSWAGLMVNYV